MRRVKNKKTRNKKKKNILFFTHSYFFAQSSALKKILFVLQKKIVTHFHQMRLEIFTIALLVFSSAKQRVKTAAYPVKSADTEYFHNLSFSLIHV